MSKACARSKDQFIALYYISIREPQIYFISYAVNLNCSQGTRTTARLHGYILAPNGEKNSNNKNYQFWQQENHPEELYSSAFIRQKLDYLHNNPVAARLVNTLKNYIYSSACDYCGVMGLLPVTIIDAVKYN